MPDDDLSQMKIDKNITASHRSRPRRIYIALTILCIAVVISLYISGILTPSIEVETTTIVQSYPSHEFTILNASGYVVAQRKAAVASRITGRIISISVEEGSSVKKGDIIARLESEDFSAVRNQAIANLESSRSQLEQAKAELYDATSLFQKNKDLFEKGFISRLEYDASEARYKKAVAAVKSAESNVKAYLASLKSADVSLEYTLLKAPFDAVVLTKNADIGDIITPLGAAANAKAAVVTIADMGSLQVEVDVSESNIQHIKVGQPCEIQLDAFPDLRFRGEVHMIVPTADRTKASVLVKIRFIDKDRRILPEMSAKVAFLSRPLKTEELKPRILIKTSSITTQDGKRYVYIVKDERAIRTQITTGKQTGEMTEIISGLKPGDRIVLNPTDRIKNNIRVKSIVK